MQIGDKVWIFDNNRRRYEDDNGNELNRPWYKAHFFETKIIGETKQSWIVEEWKKLKVNKKTLEYSTTNTYGLDGKLYISEEQINQICWIEENKYKIVDQVEHCKDYIKLKAINEILNENE
jgi:hypothetical protein